MNFHSFQNFYFFFKASRFELKSNKQQPKLKKNPDSSFCGDVYESEPRSVDAHFTWTLKNQRRRMIQAVHFFLSDSFPDNRRSPFITYHCNQQWQQKKINKNVAHISTDKRIECTTSLNKNSADLSDFLQNYGLPINWVSIPTDLAGRSSDLNQTSNIIITFDWYYSKKWWNYLCHHLPLADWI